MTHILTLVAADALPVAPGALLGLAAAPRIVVPGRVQEYTLPAAPDLPQMMRWHEALFEARTDIFATPAQNRAKKIMLCDMDATIVAEETLDELAAAAGCGPAIAAITTRAMRGEIDFATALRDRVALLRGAPAALLEDVRAHITLNDGAQSLVSAMRAQGAYSVLVTGGFTFFAADVAARCGFDDYHAHVLAIDGDKIAGTVGLPLIDRAAKGAILRRVAAARGVSLSDTLAVGDGANDLDMLGAAGLGIGYRPKPLVRDHIANCIIHGDLRAALYAQGLHPADM